MFRHDPLHAIRQVQSNQFELVLCIVRWHEVQRLQSRREAIDASHNLRVRAINVGRRKAAGTNRPEPQTRTQRIHRRAAPQAFVHGPASVEAQGGIDCRIEASTNVPAIIP